MSSFFYILVIFMMIILNFHLTHISRFSNVSCMSEELIKALSSGGSNHNNEQQPVPSIDHFHSIYQEKEIDLIFFRVIVCVANIMFSRL